MNAVFEAIHEVLERGWNGLERRFSSIRVSRFDPMVYSDLRFEAFQLDFWL